MLRHLFKLIWNRKRANLLLIIEIFFSFVVLFGVGTILVQLGANYLQPRGFDHEQVWRLNIAAGQGEKMPRTQLDEALRQVRALPGVQALTLTSSNTPFIFETHNSRFYRGEKEAPPADRYDADDHYHETLGLHLREGRWFNRTDDGQQRRPVVISRNLRDALFAPGERAIGEVLRDSRNPAEGGGNPADSIQTAPQSNSEYLIVGVVENFRSSSDFSESNPAVWLRLLPFDTTRWEGAAVMLKVKPGSGAELEQKIVRTIAGTTRQWSTQVRALDADRINKNKYTMTPVLALALVCVFLVVNVALGLFGVLWYNINQRRSEIGLRRAVGATGTSISTQFLAETLILTCFGVALGAVLAAQFPLLGAFSVPTVSYLRAIGLAAVLIFSLAAVCALQPSRLAARIQPAHALREE